MVITPPFLDPGDWTRSTVCRGRSIREITLNPMPGRGTRGVAKVARFAGPCSEQIEMTCEYVGSYWKRRREPRHPWSGQQRHCSGTYSASCLYWQRLDLTRAAWAVRSP